MDLDALLILSEQRRLVGDENDDEGMPDVASDEGESDFKGILTAEEQKLSGVLRKLREMQDACCAEQTEVPASVVYIFSDLAAEFVAVPKTQAALIEASTRIIVDICRLWKGL